MEFPQLNNALKYKGPYENSNPIAVVESNLFNLFQH